jgi:aminoglycoside phosphotransferase family enzyme/predicted kinase
MSPHRHPHPPTTEQDAVVQSLLRLETYPHHPARVTHLQTHISHVFLTGTLVYKIKKPVRYDFLDFSTLAQRGYFCRQEVQLNRRLTKDLYQGVVRITEQKGTLKLDGRGRVVEYAVLMREMPQERMMNRLLATGQVGGKEIKDIVHVLVPFYRRAGTGGAIDEDGRLAVIRRNSEENFFTLKPFVGKIVTTGDYQTVIRYARRFMDRNRRLFERRVAEGHIRDCHGDLHSGNICLEAEGIQIYDCIEFNHRFRYSDIIGDLAFLAMDLDFHGYPVLSRFLLRAYVRETGDQEAGRLVDFYKCYRACVRAKIHGLASTEEEIPAGERRKHRALAKRYFHLALSYARADRPLKIIVVFGLMGTGKTTLTQALRRETGWKVISSDVVRKRLLGLKPTIRRWEGFGQGIYSPEMSRRTYQAMREEARHSLKPGHPVILDGSYKRWEEREDLLELARDLGAEITFVECTAPASLIRQRLERRRRDPQAVSDGRWEIFRAQRADFDPTEAWIKRNGFRVRMDQPAEKLAGKLAARIEARY